ncbi:hypothetical protein GALMADRAFT_612005 [Galerina marginata CBS 339.88]|uniref:Uncharacterized protein n=1 Tax=Galerina marginata (strain CBS 339.88) TaxID=685588 RepID=A0A067T0P8_GALM3|nr:hypothetical protein GALMADRAFT_612005 [Galerina marginata CBS 339.88]
MAKIPRNPVTGRVDLPDIVKYMEQNPSAMAEFMSDYDKSGAGIPKVDLTTYDYNALASTIVHESLWVIQLESMGFVDKNGSPIDPHKAHSSSGVQPTFMIYCYDDKGKYRVMDETVGLPNSKTVLESIQRAIAEPILPLKPCLPWLLLVSVKLQQHGAVLKPFLDSLPAPLNWRFETPEEAEGVLEGVHTLNEQGVREFMALAVKAKTTGNQAFTKKDRKAALDAYGEALGHIIELLSQKPDPDDEAKAVRLRAICYANRAATYLMPGEGSDFKKALQDGKASEEVDPSYSKAQATASDMLGNTDGALDAIARALRRKDLENDVGLVDRLVELITGGKGFPKDEADFKNWMLDVLINDRKSSERLSGIKGEWSRRCDAQFAKWNKK